jgi:hypothetical protein
MNMEENRSIWQYLEFTKIFLAEHFWKIDPKSLKMMFNEKVINMKGVGNFKPYDLESKNCPKWSMTLQKSPDYGRVQKQFWDFESW